MGHFLAVIVVAILTMDRVVPLPIEEVPETQVSECANRTELTSQCSCEVINKTGVSILINFFSNWKVRNSHLKSKSNYRWSIIFSGTFPFKNV
jgi:hypothetical protein